MASRQDITELVDKEKLMKQEIKRIKSENFRDRDKLKLQKKLEDTEQRYESLQNSLKSV
ncbi:MAG: hypothetical protein ACNI28_01300 [Arcobacter sp.]|uniref:hypothetical protein n=1 Tax=Arcobacter sp. TaxID=1872629 RepID=UPI003B00C953